MEFLHNKRYVAFTLAEVLITLGIIGVVAAMTLPSLIIGQQKQATATRYQKVYSTLANMVRLSEVDNGPVDNWDFGFTPYSTGVGGTNEAFLKIYVLPYLNIAKTCGGTNTGCWATGYIKKPNGDTTGEDRPATDNNFMKYILNDGTCLAIVFRDDQNVHFYVDLDGIGGQQRVGRDIFIFTLGNKANYSSYYTANGNPPIGGLYPIGKGKAIATYNYATYGCGKDVTTDMWAGFYCGEKIIQDGYKIADDYPW